MSGVLHFHFFLESNVQKIDLNEIPEDITLKELKEKLAQAGDCKSDDIELIYRGNALNEGSTVKSVGIRPGVTIFVLKKIKNEPPKKNTKVDIDFHALSTAFKNAVRLPAFRAAYKRICRPTNLQNIMVATPDLKDDPVSLAIIQDPDLLIQMCDVSALRRIVDKHPALAEAAMYIVSVIHEEAASLSTSSTSHQSNFSFASEALSEDDDMESTNSSDSQPPAESSSITSMQLAAALAAAQSQSTSSSANTPGESSNSLITSQMLGQALGQALASSSPSTTAASNQTTPARENVSDLEATSRRLAQHLQQMHEMGLRDDVINLQALQATDWNVQEAINLVFSGGMTDNDVE